MADEPEDPRAVWPSFLVYLDEDRERAFRLFYAFLTRAVRTRQPSALRLFPVDDREDEIQELVVFFVDGRFRKLRAYQNKGKPFVGWMYRVIHNRLIERLRKRKQNPDPPSIPEGYDAPDGRPGPDQLKGPLPNWVRDALADALPEIGPVCRIVVQARILDGMKPRDIAKLFPALQMDNKQVADKVDSCLDSLRRSLSRRGVDVDWIREWLRGV